MLESLAIPFPPPPSPLRIRSTSLNAYLSHETGSGLRARNDLSRVSGVGAAGPVVGYACNNAHELGDPVSKNTSCTSVEVTGAAAGERRVLGVCSLMAIMYATVSGGPIGSEKIISQCGPLPGLIGVLVFPIIFAAPLTLVTAELATAYPDNGGFVLWVREAFGPWWSVQMGAWQWLAGVIDNALYPALAFDTLKLLVPSAAELAPGAQWGIKAVFTISLVLVALTGVRHTGPIITAFNVICILPFILLSAIAIPQVRSGATAYGCIAIYVVVVVRNILIPCTLLFAARPSKSPPSHLHPTSHFHSP